MSLPRLPAHVLILSDMPAAIALLTKALEPEGFRVTSFLAGTPVHGAPDTRVILDLETIIAMAPLPGAIVLDLDNPENQSAGQRFLTQARGDPVLGQIPLILGTTVFDRNFPGASAEPRTAGSVRVLSTPIDEDALLEVLAQVLTP